MAVSNSKSVTFAASAQAVWPRIVKLIHRAGYPILTTDNAAKHITYQSKGTGWVGGSDVSVSVIDLGEKEALVILAAKTVVKTAVVGGGHQNELFQFVLDDLRKVFPISETQREPIKAPGAAGCAAMVFLLLSSGVVLTAISGQLFTR